MNLIRPLRDLDRAQKGRIVSVEAKTLQELQCLRRAGVLPGAEVDVIHNNSRYVHFVVGSDELAVDRQIASEIYVELNVH
jgi:Fe2+ transport system protein FeoA